MNECKVIIMGFGAVGQGVANAISLKKDMIKQEHNVEVKVVAAADSSSSAICADGLDEQLLVSVKNDNGSLASYPEYGSDVCGIDVLDSVEYDCLIEATPTNIEDGEPALSLTLKAFEEGKDVVTSNKGHLALFFKDVVSAAEKNNVQFRYEATVGGAMPIINFVKDTLSSCKISSIEGILNGTTNYILSRMTSEGSSYKDILCDGQVSYHVQFLMYNGNTCLLRLGYIMKIYGITKQCYFTAVALVYSAQDFHQGGFSGAVFSHQRVHFSGF